MKTLFFALGISIVLPCLVLAGDPPCHTSEIMGCVDMAISWLKTLPKRTIPNTEDQLHTMCTEVNKALDCFHRYFDSCLTPMQKEVIDLVVEGIHGLRFEFCGENSASRAKYMAHASCLNEVSQTDQVKEAIEYIMATVEHLQYIDNSKKLTYACCGYVKGYNTFLKMGTEKCGKDAVDATKDLAAHIVAQLPDVLCNGFNEEDDRCKEVLLPDGSKPTEKVKESPLYQYAHNALSGWLD